MRNEACRSSVRILAVGLVAAGLSVPASADAQGLPIPPRGGVEVATSWPDLEIATYNAGVPLDVHVRYRPRLSSKAQTVAVAARFAVRGKCTRRPTTSDRRRLRILGSREGVLTLRGRGTFRSGTNKICLWIGDGRTFNRPRTVQRSFRKNMFAATAAESSEATGAINTLAVTSTRPINGTVSTETFVGPLPCNVKTTTEQSGESRAGFHTFGQTRFRGDGFCFAQSLQAASLGVGLANLTVGSTPPGAAPRVVSHLGDCHMDPASNMAITGPAIPAFVNQSGCRFGKIIASKSEQRRTSGLPANGAVLRAEVRGRTVYLAPRGTVVDVVIDSIP